MGWKERLRCELVIGAFDGLMILLAAVLVYALLSR
jgi:hypothetical protein